MVVTLYNVPYITVDLEYKTVYSASFFSDLNEKFRGYTDAGGFMMAAV